MKPSTYIRILFALSVVFVLTACNPVDANSVSLPTPSKQGMVTIVLTNTAPSNLDLAMKMDLFENTFTLSAVFLSQDKEVAFKQGEQLVCNGVAMPMDSSSGYRASAAPTPGTPMSCTYTSPQGQASFSFVTPAAPQLISPLSGATITRSKRTPFVAKATPSCQAISVDIESANSFGGYSGGTTFVPNGCTADQQVDTTGASAGRGTFGILEQDNSPSITNNSGFHSLSFTILEETQIPVIWK